MKFNIQRVLLSFAAVVLSVCLIGLMCYALILSLEEKAAETTYPILQYTDPTQNSADTTTETTNSTAAPTETTAPAETTVETTAPTEPQPEYFTLSFVGDCTLGNLYQNSGSHTFIGTVGDDYSYPFADVLDYFSSDDCTFINLECALTDGGTPNTSKQFVFKGPSAYTNILTQGSVEFANVVNNHAKDYGTSGYKDTLANLDAAGVHYADFSDTTVFTIESGLTIGVYAAYFPTDTSGVKAKIEAMREQGAEIVVVAVHWGVEYDYHPNSNEKKIGRQYIDAGADIVWGHHAHILQDVEEYNDGIIYYSLGNFSFGGNSNPADKDTAIIQQQIVREPDGTVHLGEMRVVPCYVTGTITYGNDYQPLPMEAGTEAYDRVLSKLDGSWPEEDLYVPYRHDPTEPTEPEETVPEETTPEETVPAETTPEQTVPEETVPEETAPVETPTEPSETPTEPSEAPTEPAETPTEPAETPTEAPAETPTEPAETPTEAPAETPAETPTE